jgi:nitrate reductase NapAB chaperone NapD
MAICSYLVIPQPGSAAALCERLSGLPGCEVVPALNRDLLVLVTDTADRDEENALRERIEGLDGIQALMLTYGQVDA